MLSFVVFSPFLFFTLKFALCITGPNNQVMGSPPPPTQMAVRVYLYNLLENRLHLLGVILSSFIFLSVRTKLGI